ncbi:MAG: hypothetical protein IMZ44_21815 [Planctomycetes bacterium]|nr:hypothetical protein [Planctomycetota bacterium]
MPSNPLAPFVARRLRYLVLAAPIVVGHNLIHEATHYLAALAYGEGVVAFRFLSNGLGSSQVVFASPVAARTGWHWLIIAWAPSVVTTLIGYALYASRARLRWNRWVALFALYAGFFFLLLDPFYLSVLSLLVGGDIGAASVAGWPWWPVRAVALLVLILNVCLVRRWLAEHGAQYPTVQPRHETPAVQRSLP